MNAKQSIDRTIFSPASLHGQGIAAAPQGVLCEAKYGVRKTRNCEKPGFLRSKKWPQCGNRTESGGGISLSAKKTLSIQTEDSLRIRAKGSLNITSDKAVNLKGKNIKMSGTKGVTAEGKQLAVQGDKVMGFDIQIMVVPSGNGTTTVPLPHPFIGKLADKLSKDVKIKDKSCATKDSVAKHDDTMHMQQWAIGSWCNAKKQF